MQVTCTPWVLLHNTRDIGREKIYRLEPVQKRERERERKQKISLSLHDLPFTDRNLLRVSFTRSLNSNLCTDVSIQNTTENKCVILHTTALQPNVFLTGIHRFVVPAKRRPASLSRRNCQDQIQTCESLYLTAGRQLSVQKRLSPTLDWLWKLQAF
jgi:hypothetical protein